jgi:dTDP-4-amino-4,6-dideoxygalactose transaminase
MINVTKPFLPPLEDYQGHIARIWERGWLTNDGPAVNELEKKLKEYLNVENALFVSNGTIALQIAIKALELKGEIITTPFSFIATASSIIWEGCKPVMVDILPTSLNIDPTKIEAAITPQTTAILATHVYGNACEIEQIEQIAKKYNLKVIYDAAHTFGAKYNGQSLFSYGDISTTSFHATKLFHTIEGGAIFAKDAELSELIGKMRNFGFESATEFACIGINGKNSEFHAAMGLCNLAYIDDILSMRKSQSQQYTERLKSLPIQFITITEKCDFNYAYYPIILESEALTVKLIADMQAHNIYPRRYFSPSLSSLPYLPEKYETPVSDDISGRVLCLPLYHTLTTQEIDLVCDVISKSLRA